MLKLVIILLVILLQIVSINAQSQLENANSNIVIQLPEFYDGYGVIFKQNVIFNFIDPKNTERFDPDLSDIILAERTILNKLNTHFEEDSNSLKDYKYKLRNNYYRQYLGYTDSLGYKFIVINFLNFKKTRIVL